jgi:hypothetical protein
VSAIIHPRRVNHKRLCANTAAFSTQICQSFLVSDHIFKCYGPRGDELIERFSVFSLFVCFSVFCRDVKWGKKVVWHSELLSLNNHVVNIMSLTLFLHCAKETLTTTTEQSEHADGKRQLTLYAVFLYTPLFSTLLTHLY